MRGVDGVVVVGAALAIGGVWPFARAEVAVAFVVLAVVLARAQGVGAAARAALLAGCAIAGGGLRAASTLRDFTRTMGAADAVIPRPTRCAGMARVESSPVRVGGAIRWQAEFRDAECDGASGPSARQGGAPPVAWAGRVTLFGGPERLARGDDVAVVADLAGPNRMWNTQDPRAGEARRGDVRSGGVVDARIVTSGRGLLAAIDRARWRVRERIDATFTPDVAPMARALVLGESDLAPEDDAAIRASGLAHLLAVSGMHLIVAVLGAVAAIRMLLLRVERLAAGRDVGALAAGLGVPLAWIYAELAGDAGATKRAAWMVTVGFVARALGRKSDPWRAFGWSLVLMACGDALVAFDASFALSAAATAGLLAFSRPAKELAERAPKIVRPLVHAALTSLAASTACAPVVARFAPTLPLGGVVANLLAVPLGESVALPLCLVHTLLFPWPAAERGCAWTASLALRLVRLIGRAFASLSALALHVPTPSSWQLVALAAGIAAVALAARGKRAPPLFATVAALLLLEVGIRRAGAPTGVLRVTFLDVAQGDSALIDLPDGRAMIVDGGGFVGSPVDPGVRVVAPVLRARRRDALALAVLTHPHPDHFTGLASGLADTRVGALWDTGQGEREGVGGAYATLLASMRRRSVPVVRPEGFCGAHDLGGARIDVLAPCPDSSPDRNPNDNSIVFRIAYGARAFLFVGDAEREEEADLLRLDPARLRADVLKVGHHGSRTSSSPMFLTAVGAREAIISNGPRNRFGHPHPTTLAALSAARLRVWRTDRDGAVTVTTNGASLDVETAAGTTARIDERDSNL